MKGKFVSFLLLSLLQITGIFGQTCAVELEKMNAVFAGMENPVRISVYGYPNPDSSIQVTASLGELIPRGHGHYIWKICSRDSSAATLTLRDKMVDTLIAVRQYRVKQLPEPTVVIGYRDIEGFRANNLTRASGAAMILENFDFEARCNVLSFDMEYVKKGQDPTPVITNNGARFNERIQSYINQATTGDRYYFFNFKYVCGCDPQVRKHLESLSYIIR